MTNRQIITVAYLKSWFLIDIASILPFWIVTFDFADPLGANAAQLVADGADGPTNSPTILMVFRLLRLLKLARVLKASKVLQRQLLDIAMNRCKHACHSTVAIATPASQPRATATTPRPSSCYHRLETMPCLY